MPLSQGLKFFRKILKNEIVNNGIKLEKIKIQDNSSFITIELIGKNTIATFRVNKIDVLEMINNTKENYSLIYLVKNIEWGNFPL
jgi:hypothetical protein